MWLHTVCRPSSRGLSPTSSPRESQMCGDGSGRLSSKLPLVSFRFFYSIYHDFKLRARTTHFYMSIEIADTPYVCQLKLSKGFDQINLTYFIGSYSFILHSMIAQYDQIRYTLLNPIWDFSHHPMVENRPNGKYIHSNSERFISIEYLY